MAISITAYDAICNLGNNIDTIYEQAISGNTNCFNEQQDYVNLPLRAGLINTDFPNIDNKDFDIRCNKLILKNLELIQSEISLLLKKYNKDKISIVTATTNSGVEEFETTHNSNHYELGNPAKFLREHLNLKGYYTTVSTACSSGIKAFSLAKDLLENEISEAVIVVCVDTLAKVPVFGFNSLEVLTNNPCIPFSKNRTGMNIGEACSIFILEKNVSKGIKIMGIGESSDIYHPTTPDPEAKEAISAIKMALQNAKIRPEDVDYINVHGTGTHANDMMEAKAISEVFGNNTPVSSTKPMTGHCLGAAAGIETALCCKLLEKFDGKLYPHIYDNKYDENLPSIKLVNKNEIYSKCNICMCNSFGFGGSNAILILGIMNNKEYLSKILPHKTPMLLIDDIADYSIEEKWLKSVVTITEKSLFYDKNLRGIDSVVGIEYMAQTIGCYAYFRKNLTEPKVGFLLGTRLYNNAIKKFELGKTYYIMVKEVFVAEIYSFECFIYNEDNEEVASATINVYQEDRGNYV